ncbi:MAG: hypothetical protein J7621_04160 [Niastella sp.]|nr:hypothetical protein [Niastella sp.]
MKLEYLDNLSDGGKFQQVVSENLVRLYDFDQDQTEALVHLIHQNLLLNKQALDLSSVAFIESVNCQLILQLSQADKGVLPSGQPNSFVCYLTEASYQNMVGMMKASSGGHHWLCDTSEADIDFLYSSGGMW